MSQQVYFIVIIIVTIFVWFSIRALFEGTGLLSMWVMFFRRLTPWYWRNLYESECEIYDKVEDRLREYQRDWTKERDIRATLQREAARAQESEKKLMSEVESLSKKLVDLLKELGSEKTKNQNKDQIIFHLQEKLTWVLSVTKKKHRKKMEEK